MDLRVFTEPQQGATYDDLLRVATATEELGFDAFFRSDHYLGMGTDGMPGPTDAWTTLAGLARETSRIRLGTLMTSATFRLPGPLAITVAQVDAMSGGRVELGIGAGWFEAEHTSYGIPFPGTKERFDRFEEQLAIITGLWRTAAGERFTHEKRFYPVTDSPALPKPVQSPHPPVILAGNGPKSIERAAQWADGWMPIAGRGDTADQVDALQKAAADRGRGPLPVTVFGARPKPDVLSGYAAAGVERALLALPSAPAADTLRRLDRYAELIDPLA
jgi:F420-dependent oxidoreductase-like protein